MVGPQQTSQGICCQPCVLHTRHVCYYPHTAPHPIPFVQYMTVVADMSPCVLHKDTYVIIPHPTPSPNTPPWKSEHLHGCENTCHQKHGFSATELLVQLASWTRTSGSYQWRWEHHSATETFRLESLFLNTSRPAGTSYEIQYIISYWLSMAFKASVYTAVKCNRFCWRVFIRCLFHNSSLETVWFLRPFWARFWTTTPRTANLREDKQEYLELKNYLQVP